MIKNNITFTVLISMLIFLSCKSSNDTDNTPANIEEKIVNQLDTLNTDADFTLLIKSKNGQKFSHSRGSSTETTSYRSASTSKWITAAIILSVVQDGNLSLDDHPQKYISSWETSGNLSKITLRHLLSFTSGLSETPLCVNLAISNFETCVDRIANKNDAAKLSGSEFYYGPNHMQVAGLMAIKASGKSTWQDVFSAFKTKTSLFPTSTYDLPSTNNPKLAAGMHWKAIEYLDFLEALFKKTILTPELITLMTSDQFDTNTTLGNSPALDGIGEDWHYGFGAWVECHSSTNDCTQTTKVSSPGLYGAYPFIDFEHNYYGILAREGSFNTFTKGYDLFTSVSTDLEQWADEN